MRAGSPARVLLLRHDKPAACGGLGEALGQLRHGLLECRAVKAAARHSLPGDLVIRTRQRVGVNGSHVRLDRILNALDFGSQFVGHAAQFSKLVDLALNFCVAHVETPFLFRRGVLY